MASNKAKSGGANSSPHQGSSLGGGIANAGTSLVINDSLVGNNSRDSSSPGGGPDVSGAVTSSYSLISQTSGAMITDLGGNILNQNPQLDPNGLLSNGGPTLTVALEDDSPALDVIPVSFCPIRTDQRGMPRPGLSEGLCDIGAFEFQDVPFASFTAKLDVTLSTGTFKASSKFTLSSRSNSIDPVTEEVTLHVGHYIVVIPPGSFSLKKGSYVFEGNINGVSLNISVTLRQRYQRPRARYQTYEFLASGSGANFNGLVNPVTVALTIGNERGSAQVIARIR
jgi:hypothetical protein